MKETYADARRRLAERRKRLERMRAEERAMHEKIAEVEQRAYWFTALLRPLAIELKRETGAKAYTLGGPFGLSCEWYLELEYADGRRARLTGALGHWAPDYDMELEYHTGETVERYEPGTVGAVNGMNRITAPLPLAAPAILPLLRWKDSDAD